MAIGPDVAVTAVKAAVTHISLHTASPGSGGGSEVTGGGYARRAVTWGSVTSGSVPMTGTLSFAGPAGGDAKYWGAWTAASGGSFVGGGALTGDQTFSGAGSYTVTSLSIAVF